MVVTNQMSDTEKLKKERETDTSSDDTSSDDTSSDDIKEDDDDGYDDQIQCAIDDLFNEWKRVRCDRELGNDLAGCQELFNRTEEFVKAHKDDTRLNVRISMNVPLLINWGFVNSQLNSEDASIRVWAKAKQHEMFEGIMVVLEDMFPISKFRVSVWSSVCSAVAFSTAESYFDVLRAVYRNGYHFDMMSKRFLDICHNMCCNGGLDGPWKVVDFYIALYNQVDLNDELRAKYILSSNTLFAHIHHYFMMYIRRMKYDTKDSMKLSIGRSISNNMRTAFNFYKTHGKGTDATRCMIERLLEVIAARYDLDDRRYYLSLIRDFLKEIGGYEWLVEDLGQA